MTHNDPGNGASGSAPGRLLIRQAALEELRWLAGPDAQASAHARPPSDPAGLGSHGRVRQAGPRGPPPPPPAPVPAPSEGDARRRSGRAAQAAGPADGINPAHPLSQWRWTKADPDDRTSQE